MSERYEHEWRRERDDHDTGWIDECRFCGVDQRHYAGRSEECPTLLRRELDRAVAMLLKVLDSTDWSEFDDGRADIEREARAILMPDVQK